MTDSINSTEKSVGVPARSNTILIPILEIVVSRLDPQKRRRLHFNAQEIAELGQSIRDHGLINPITVRPIPGAKKGYELVAGERRLLATKKAGFDSIEAIVRDLSDQATIEIQLIENLKRQNVEPLDEAFSYNYLLEHAQIEERGAKRPYTIADIAARFARTDEIIMRRLKLMDLCEKGKDDLGGGFLPLAHAELLARFPENTQAKLLKDDVYRYSYSGDRRTAGAVTLKDLQDKVTDNNVTRILTQAKFNREDPSLHKDGLTCSACTQRTGYSPKLFNDTKLGNKDSCLNPTCWDSKLRAMLIVKREAMAAKLPNPNNLPLKELVLLVPLVKTNAYYEHRDVSIGNGTYLKNDYGKQAYNEVKQLNECPNVEKALRVGGKGIGSTTMICRDKSCGTHKFKKESSSSYDYQADELKRQEKGLNEAIAEAVRRPLVAKMVDDFNESTWVFDTPEGKRDLLVGVLHGMDWSLWRELAESQDFPKSLKAQRYNIDRPDVVKAVAGMSIDQVSRIFALICFAFFGKGDEAAVRQLVAESGENYDLLAAKARMKHVPAEHKPAAQSHLDSVIAGKASKPPTVYWPRKKKEKAKPKAKAKAAGK